MEKILLIGDDFYLMATRAAVLAKTKASVTCCNSREFAALSEPDHFSLVVLCHSLAPDTARHIGEEVRRRWSQARTLLILKGNGEPSSVESNVDATVPAAEPARLIELAMALLAKSPEGRRRLPKGVPPSPSADSGAS
jgi:hypothetical protein